MEGSEGALDRVGRAVWTVWGYLTGAVGRYLRPEVRNEEALSVHQKQENTVPISASYKNLKIKEEEKESQKLKTHERVTQEDLQYSGISVQAAAVQWEKGNIAYDSHKVKFRSKPTYSSAEGTDKKSQIKKNNEKTLDDKSKTHCNLFPEQVSSPAYSDADEKNQDRPFSGSEEANLNVEQDITCNEEWTKKPEEKGKIKRERNDASEEELIESELIGQGSLVQEGALNVKRKEISEKQRGKEEQEKEIDDQNFRIEFEETKEKTIIKRNFTEQGLLAKEVVLKAQRDESCQKQKRNSKEEEGEENMWESYDYTEKGSITSEFIEETDLSVEKSESSQEQRRKQDEEGVGQILKKENDETGQKCEFIDPGLSIKEDYLNVETSKSKQAEKGVDEIMKRANNKHEEDINKITSVDQGLLTEKVDVNVEWSESSQTQRRKEEEADGKEGVDEIIKTENDETGNELIKSTFVDEMIENGRTKVELIRSEFTDQDILTKESALNVEKSESKEEEYQREEDEVDKITKKENDECEEESIKMEICDQGLLTKEVDVNVECKGFKQEKRNNVEKEVVEITRREHEETEEGLIKNKFIEQILQEADLDVEKDENSHEQKRKSQEGEDETMRREHYETDDLIKRALTDQDLVIKEADHHVEMSESSQEQRKEECVEIIKEKDENGEKLNKDVDLNVKRSETNQEEAKRTDGNITIMMRDNDETGKEPFTSEFPGQTLLTKEDDLNVLGCKNNLDQKSNDTSKKKTIASECIEQGLLIKTVDPNVEWSENNQGQKMKEKDEDVDIIREEDEPGEPIKSLLSKKADLRIENNSEQTKKTEDNEEEGEGGVAEIIKTKNDVGEEPVKSGFTDQVLLNKEIYINIESNENNQDQRRQEKTREWDKFKEETIKSEFLDQYLLANKATLTVDESETPQEQTKTVEEEERVENIIRIEHDETFKSEFVDQGLLTTETDLNQESSESNQQQLRKPAQKLLRSDLSNQGLLKREDDHGPKSKQEEEECCVDEKMRSENIKSEEQGALAKKSDLNIERNESSQEQIRKKESKGVDEIMLRANDEDEEEPLKDKCVDRDVDLEHQEGLCDLEDIGVFHVASMEKIMESVDNQDKNELHVVEESNYATNEHKNEASNSQMVDLPSLAPTLEQMNPLNQNPLNQSLQPLVEIPENAILQNITSEMGLSVELVDTAQNGSQRAAIMTKQEHECVNIEPKTGNQVEDVETTSQFRAEVAAVDMKKSAKGDNSLQEQPIDRDDVALQEVTGQCILKKESKYSSSYEAPFSDLKSLSFDQVEESAIVSLNAKQSSSLQKLDESSSDTEIEVEATLSSSKQRAEEFEMLSKVTTMCKQVQPKCVPLVDNTYDKLIVDDIPLEDQINQHRFTVQCSAAEGSSLSKALYSKETEPGQKCLGMQTDSQKYMEEQERTISAGTGLLDEIQDVTSCLCVEEKRISGLTTDSKETDWELLREREASKGKEYKNELEGIVETLVTNTDLDLQNAAWDCEKQSIVVTTGWEMESVETTDKPIHKEESKYKHHVVFSELKASNEISKEHKEKVGHGDSVTDSKEDERGTSRLKRAFEMISGDNHKDKPSVLTDLLLPSQASSLDFTVQKSKIAVKNPLIRPPKDPRTLINMASVEPMTPHPPLPSQSSFLKRSHVEDASVPGKGVIGFKLPGMNTGFPALRKTEAGRKMRDGDDSKSETSQKSDPGLQSANDNVKQEASPPKPKWTPPRQPGMGSPLMMAELKSKLKKPAKE